MSVNADTKEIELVKKHATLEKNEANDDDSLTTGSQLEADVSDKESGFKAYGETQVNQVAQSASMGAFIAGI